MKKICWRFIKKQTNEYCIEIEGISIITIQKFLLSIGVKRKHTWITFNLPYDENEQGKIITYISFKNLNYKHIIKNFELYEFYENKFDCFSCVYVSQTNKLSEMDITLSDIIYDRFNIYDKFDLFAYALNYNFLCVVRTNNYLIIKNLLIYLTKTFKLKEKDDYEFFHILSLY